MIAHKRCFMGRLRSPLSVKLIIYGSIQVVNAELTGFDH